MKTKRFLSVVLALLMLGTIFSGLTVSAYDSFNVKESKDSGKIYFEPIDKNASNYYAHIMEYKTKKAFFGYQVKREKLQVDSNGKLYYDLNKLNESTMITGGLKEDTPYLITIGDSNGNDTTELLLYTSCIGDTIYATSDKADIEMRNNSMKNCYSVAWKNNADKIDIPLHITKKGAVQGKCLPKDTTPDDVINEWNEFFPDYPNELFYSSQSSARNHADRLAEIKVIIQQMVDDGKITVVGGEVYSEQAPTTEPTTDSTTVNTEPTTSDIQPTTQLMNTVNTVTKVSLNKKSITLVKGKSTTAKATVTPSNVTNKNIKWTTSNTKIATVNASGKITAKSKGVANIKAMATDGSKKYATLKVTVKQPVTSVKLNRNTATLKLKGKANQKTVTLKATVLPKNASNKAVTWKSTKTNIATVNAKGKVTAKKKGTCYVIATAKDGSKKSAKCKITVK